MEILATKNFEGIIKSWKEGYRRCLLEGGTSSSKTWSVLQSLILIAKKAVDPLLISVVSESLPHLKRGAIRDFFSILGESQDNNPNWSKTEFTYKHPGWKGSIEFFGADNADKVRGPRRDILFINEGNNVPWETARGLDIRTSRFTIVDWNPVSEFYAHEFWKDEPSTLYVHSTYLDSRDVLPAQVIRDIESYRGKDPNWWNIYGLGLIGKVEGLVHPYFEQVDDLPEGETAYGLDWGFASDPTVLVKNVFIGDKVYSKQLLWSSGMTNQQIAQQMDLLHVKKEPIYADPSEPKSIEEIRRCGFNIMEAVKGPGSVEFGIQKVNQFFQFWTKDSLDCIKEQRNFRYIKRIVQGVEQWTDDTTHQWSHGISARRYAVASHRQVAGGSRIIPVVQPRGSSQPMFKGRNIIKVR